MPNLKTIFRRAHSADQMLAAIMALLVAGGLVILASASSNLGEVNYGDSYYYLKHQILYGLTLGIAGFLIASRVHYTWLKKVAFPLLIVSALCLLLVPFVGVTVQGATRWLAIGPITFQPSELLKITYILYLAAWLSGASRRRTQDVRTGFLPFLIVSGGIALLLMLQPATSTLIILLGSGLILYTFGGAPFKYFLISVLLGVVAIGALISITGYQLDRIKGFLNPSETSQAEGFHTTQALIAIGSGGITGVGYGESTTKVSFLPEPTDDSIFAVAAEEFGFIGSSIIVALFGSLVVRLYMLAWRTKDQFGQLLLVGFGTVIGAQAFVNMAVISGMGPLTGVPLPFISYGGTALAVFMTMIGISSNVSANN